MFGEPIGKGFDKQEREVWSYAYGMRTSQFNAWDGSDKSKINVKNLSIIFNDNGAVRKYVYNTPDIDATYKAGN